MPKQTTKGLCFLHQVPGLYRESTIAKVSSVMEEMSDEHAALHTDVREDLTNKLKVFTIDHQDSKSLDDALSVEEIDGNLVIGVHITDVTSIVQKDDALDKEARKRTTTFVEGRRSRHMFPEPISNNLCSLLPGKNRRALSVFFKINTKGKIIKNPKPIIKKTVVRSCRKYSYKEVQEVLNGKG